MIDDNASDWKRVFEVLAQRLGAGVGPVAFEFSTDAATVKVDKDASIDMWQVLPEYDAVLLDIYLPWPKTLAHQEPDVPFGLEVLKRIRTMLIRLPVIVWTSSMRPDLPARATMANGFLFKKDTTLGGIADTLGRWLVQGRSKRGSVLLHPFFDYGITSPMLRPQAVMLTNWSLKFVDSFHALDTSFYRFFNDHGGRHTTGVLALTERLLASLLMGDRALVFSDAPEERQMELFSIYVAALCHDVGMFPFDSDEQDRSRLGSKQRGRRIRRQHALRGLSLVWRCETYTSDRNFGELARMLGNMKACLEEQQDGRGKRCLARIALMVAYHSGLSDFARGFCTLDGNAEKRLNGNTGPNALTAEAVKGMLTEIDGALAEGDGTGGSRDRLRRACAVLRLADELDVDWTRTPAGFILQDPDRSLRDDTENFKRQVLRHVQVDRGEILLRFRCGPPVVAEVRNLLTTDLPEGEKATVLAGFSAWFGKMQNPRFTERPDGAMVEAIDDGLNRFFIRQERTDGQRQAAAFLTAVRVCTEMVAPYEHVMEVGLGCHIHFGQVDWGTFDAGELTILRFPPAGDAALCRGCHHVVIP